MPECKKGIAYIHWGNSWQLRSYQDFNHWIDELIYIHDLPMVDLNAYRCVIMPDAMEANAPSSHAAQLNAYRRNGGTLVVFLQGHADWLDVPRLKWTPGNCRDWLWWTKGNQLEIHLSQPPHPITKSIPLSAMSWHWGGSYSLPDGARSILALDDNAGHLFLDWSDPSGGRLLLATLDPHSHNGQRFMPATTLFLQGFYPWLNSELGIVRTPRNRFTYLQCSRVPTEWYPDWVDRSLIANGFYPTFRPLYDLDEEMLTETDILYLPFSHDEVFLGRQQNILLNYLERGGSMIICAEPCRPWLPFLSTFRAVPPRPFTNIKVRLRDDRFNIFEQLGEDFDGWQGIFGQYARGWTDPPLGAHWLTDVGAEHDPKPADWLWRYPSAGHRGGFIFMHNGDNMTRYPDHGEKRGELVSSIANALTGLMEGRLVY